MSDDYMKTYRDFWADLVETDGKLDLDKVARELSDYSFLMHEVPKVYDHVSGGMISKPNTHAFEVKAAHDQRRQEECDEAVKEATEELTAERDAALLQVNDLRRLMGPYSTVEIALKAQEATVKRCQEANSEVNTLESENDDLNRQVEELRKHLSAVVENCLCACGKEETCNLIAAGKYLRSGEKRIREDHLHDVENIERCKVCGKESPMTGYES